MARHAIDNNDNIIDSRDVIKRYNDLKDEKDDLVLAVANWHEEHDEEHDELLNTQVPLTEEEDDRRNVLTDELATLQEALDDWEDDNADELKVLEKLNEEGESNTSEWVHGVTMIRESHWKEYAQELAEDIGDMPKDLPNWIVSDWEATADNLKADYSEVDYDGVTYLVRD